MIAFRLPVSLLEIEEGEHELSNSLHQTCELGIQPLLDCLVLQLKDAGIKECPLGYWDR